MTVFMSIRLLCGAEIPTLIDSFKGLPTWLLQILTCHSCSLQPNCHTVSICMFFHSYHYTAKKLAAIFFLEITFEVDCAFIYLSFKVNYNQAHLSVLNCCKIQLGKILDSSGYGISCIAPLYVLALTTWGPTHRSQFGS